jgi:sarcosine oxidase subunit delta
MLLIRCPYCEEERPELEFRHAGEAHIARPADWSMVSDAEFEKFFFIRSNPKGLIFERWRHIHGCARFFNAARDTVSDKFVVTYKAGELKPDIAATDSVLNRPQLRLEVATRQRLGISEQSPCACGITAHLRIDPERRCRNHRGRILPQSRTRQPIGTCPVRSGRIATRERASNKRRDTSVSRP